MPNQKVLVKKIFYNVCMARRLGGLQMSYFKKKKLKGKGTKPPVVFMKVTFLLH